MKRKIASFARRLRRDQNGAVAVLVAMAIAAFIGLGALAIDIGRIAWARQLLQATTDMAAISGAVELSCTSCPGSAVIAAATKYSATGTNLNANAMPGFNVTMAATYPQLACLTTIGSYNSTTHTCLGAGGYNAVEVQQQTTVPFLLGEVFGFGSVTLTATSWAAKSGAFPPMHIMIVLDNTGSMTGTTDPTGNCPPSNYKIDCALGGVQALLGELWPTQDYVGLIVFPPLTASSIAGEYSCNQNPTPTPQSYNCAVTSPPAACSSSTSATYTVLPIPSSASSNNYRTSNTGSLSTSGGSNLVAATCQCTTTGGRHGSTTCNSSSCSNGVACNGLDVVGGQGTYLAGAITAAQNALCPNPCTPPTTYQNVIIVLSDGGAGNAVGQATTNASTAKAAKTLNFASGSLPTVTLVQNSPVCDTNNFPCPSTTIFPANTTVTGITSTSVTLSNGLNSSIASGKTIYFGGYNQCNASITAAQTAAGNSIWVYSIAYGSGLGDAQPDTVANTSDFTSCSDVESPPVNSCYTMYKIASDPSKFYSDPMVANPTSTKNCVSPYNPNATSISQIFEQLPPQFASLIPIGTQ